MSSFASALRNFTIHSLKTQLNNKRQEIFKMSKKTKKSYFFTAFLTILLAVGVFVGLKKVLPQKLFPENNSTEGTVIDSFAIEAISSENIDTTLVADTVFDADTLSYNINLSASKHTEGYNFLVPFFKKLEALELTGQGKIRIAYFGDSMNDGDYIVQDIRSLFQEMFGGEGVGFVSITSQSASSRYSVTHQFSKNWTTQTFLSTKTPKYPFGVDGQVAFTNDNASSLWVRYRANNQPHATNLPNATLFYGKSENQDASIAISADNDSIVTKKLDPENILNTIKLTTSSKNLKVVLNKSANIPFYGINFDENNGVYVDNFSLRGNSGLPLSSFNFDLMRAFSKELDYDLVIFQYGTNVLSYKTSDYSWYNSKMTNSVNHVRNCFPHASTLILSVADRSIKKELEMKTDPYVIQLSKAQKEYAGNTKSAFINLYSLMGGENSMVTWVNESLANKDYTHFNPKGSKKLGKLIFDEIQKGYTEYKQQSKVTTHSPTK